MMASSKSLVLQLLHKLMTSMVAYILQTPWKTIRLKNMQKQHARPWFWLCSSSDDSSIDIVRCEMKASLLKALSHSHCWHHTAAGLTLVSLVKLFIDMLMCSAFWPRYTVRRKIDWLHSLTAWAYIIIQTTQSYESWIDWFYVRVSTMTAI